MKALISFLHIKEPKLHLTIIIRLIYFAEKYEKDQVEVLSEDEGDKASENSGDDELVRDAIAKKRKLDRKCYKLFI